MNIAHNEERNQEWTDYNGGETLGADFFIIRR